MDIEWVRIRSWHAIRTYTRVPGGVITVCGRRAVTVGVLTSDDGDSAGIQEVHPTSDVLPAGRSCETCLRIVTRKADR